MAHQYQHIWIQRTETSSSINMENNKIYEIRPISYHLVAAE